MHNIILEPNDAIAINKVRIDQNEKITELSIQHGIDGRKKSSYI